jgi:hypothetical protein
VHRLPLLWQRVERLETPAHLARLVARRTRDLGPEQAAYVDSRVTPYADGRLTWTRFQTLVDASVKAADPERAAAAERRAAEQQVAMPTHSDEHGMRGLYIRAPFATVAVFDAALERVAQILADLGDTECRDRRRVKALLILSRSDLAARLVAGYRAWCDRRAGPVSPSDESEVVEPARTGERPGIDWATLLPNVVIHAHLYPGAVSDGIARVEGYGSVTETWVRDHLPAQARFSIRPVLDIPGLAPVDSYEIPERHRRAVQIMTPADIFPFSSALGEGHQIDHTERFEHGRAAVGAGQSRVGNYGPMSTPHHRLKTFGRWTAKQPFRASTSGETPTAPCISSITPALVLWAERPDGATRDIPQSDGAPWDQRPHPLSSGWDSIGPNLMGAPRAGPRSSWPSSSWVDSSP